MRVDQTKKMKSQSPLAARISLGITAILALLIPLGVTLNEATDFALLRETVQVTDGKVTKKHCENHGKLSYSYAVDGHVYRGFGTPRDKLCDDLIVGENIPIFYSAEKPQLSRSDSLESWQGEINGMLFVLSLFGLGAAVAILYVTRVDNGP